MDLHDLKITQYDTITAADTHQIVACIEDSFGKSIHPDFLAKKFTKIFRFGNWEGVALIRPFNGFTYMDKLAIRRKYQGLGFGHLLLASVIADTHSLVWRASSGNMFQEFYFKVCDGFIKTATWHIFWLGYPLDDKLVHAIRDLSQRPADFQ